MMEKKLARKLPQKMKECQITRETKEGNFFPFPNVTHRMWRRLQLAYCPDFYFYPPPSPYCKFLNFLNNIFWLVFVSFSLQFFRITTPRWSAHQPRSPRPTHQRPNGEQRQKTQNRPHWRTPGPPPTALPTVALHQPLHLPPTLRLGASRARAQRPARHSPATLRGHDGVFGPARSGERAEKCGKRRGASLEWRVVSDAAEKRVFRGKKVE